MEQNYIDIFTRVKEASRSYRAYDRIDDVLRWLAYAIEKRTDELLAANQKDLEALNPDNPKYDRLRLTAKRISGMANDLRAVAALSSPLGRVLSEFERPNKLVMRKVTVPVGVIGVVYEARPNVTTDVVALCLKSGNACLLKGSSDAQHSNSAIMAIVSRSLREFDLNEDLAVLLPAEREATMALLQARQWVDLLIPRGSQSLIDFVRSNATMPTIETGAGIVHTFVDKCANIERASWIVNNAKTRRVSVCNALDCLLIHRDKIQDLPLVVQPLADSHVLLYADPQAMAALHGRYPRELIVPADETSWGTEFLSYKMAVRTVANIDEALEHIERYSSRHSEAIVSDDEKNIALFMNRVDAAVVYVNASTAFTDGAQFGMGAEIGISTQKIHARGPMGLQELTTYKWLVMGNGQIRNN